jgi:type II secretory pathway component PulC
MDLKRFLLLSNILLTGLVIWAGVSIVATWASNRQAADSALAAPAKTPIPRDLISFKGKRLEDYGLIASRDVFHTTKEMSKRGAKGAREEIKVTELNLELKGTVVGDGKGSSYAFILDKESGKEEVYYANDFVMGARIAAIVKGRVILNVDGREEALLMVDESRTLPEMGALEEKAGGQMVKPLEQKPSPQRTIPSQRRVITPRRGMEKPGSS